MTLPIHEIEDRIEQAFSTLSRMPENGKHRAVRTFWPEASYTAQELWSLYNREEVRAPRVVPSAWDISRMNEVLFYWMPLLRVKKLTETKQHYEIVAARALGFPWRKIGRQVGMSHTQAIRVHASCLISIQMRLKRGDVKKM